MYHWINDNFLVLFRLYDADKDGFVSQSDATQILREIIVDELIKKAEDGIGESISNFMKTSPKGLTEDEFHQVRCRRREIIWTHA